MRKMRDSRPAAARGRKHPLKERKTGRFGQWWGADGWGAVWREFPVGIFRRRRSAGRNGARV